MTKYAYQYVVLRCVPRVDREEFVNVGVILFSQGADFLDARFRLDIDRLRALHPAVDVDAVAASLETVCAICAGTPGAGRPDLGPAGRRFGWLAAPRSTVVQPSPVHSGLTTDPSATLDRLLDEYVG